MTLQDLADIKIEINKPDDSIFHLRECEQILHHVKKDDKRIPTQLLRAALDRNNRLFKYANEKLEERHKPE